MENKGMFAKKCIAEALITLMEEKDYQDISLTQICDRAGFSRMSYYRNFRSKDDILITYMTILADEFHNITLSKIPNVSGVSYDFLTFTFSYFKKHSHFFTCLLNANLSSVIQYGLNYYMDRYYLNSFDDMIKRYRMYYYAGGICNLFTTWINRGMKESEEDMAKIVFDRLNHPSTAAN